MVVSGNHIQDDGCGLVYSFSMKAGSSTKYRTKVVRLVVTGNYFYGDRNMVGPIAQTWCAVLA